MKTIKQIGLVALLASGVVMGGLGLVLAQTTPATPEAETTTELRLHGPRGLGGGLGLRGLPFGHALALGTEVEVAFYAENPEAGGTASQTLTFTYGEDSEAAFADQLAEARQDASFMTVGIGEQTRTVDLLSVTLPADGRSLLPRELAFRRGLAEGGTVTATFYDGDPEAGGQVLQTLTFTYGRDSAAGFASDFAAAAQGAAFMTVTTSPQSYTVDLTAAPGDGSRPFRGGRGWGPGRVR